MFGGYDEKAFQHQTAMRTIKETPLPPRKELSSHTRIQQQSAVLRGPVAILWDIENCPVPSEVKAEDVAGNIRMALRLHPVIEGAVTLFSAYGDFNHFPRKVREGCQRTGVNLIDVPNGKKDASDKAILVDLFLFALDNPPPCTIFLISGDVDFAPALHKLGQRGYAVVLAIPSGVPVSSALCSAGRFVWYWPSLARGEGLVPVKSFACRPPQDDRQSDMSAPASLVGGSWSSGEDSDRLSDDLLYGEERIVWKQENGFGGFPPSRMAPHTAYGSSVVGTSQLACQPFVVGPLPVYLEDSIPLKGNNVYSSNGVSSSSVGQRSSQVVPGRDVSASTGPRDTSVLAKIAADSVESDHKGSVPTGGLQNLREQLVQLLGLHGGKLELVRVPPEYFKQYAKPLYLADYGFTKLVPLLEKMREWLYIRGEGPTKVVHLTKSGSRVFARSKREAKVSRAVHVEESEASVCTKVTSDLSVACEGEKPACAKTDVKAEKAELYIKGTEESSSDDLEAQIPAYGWRYDSGDEKTVELEEEKDVSVDDSSNERSDVSGGVAEGSLSDDQQDEDEVVCLDVKLKTFKQELQELLVSHAYKICMTSFLTLYEQRYSRALDCSSFGVQGLESLIEKVNDVTVLVKDPGSGLKYLMANCGR